MVKLLVGNKIDQERAVSREVSGGCCFGVYVLLGWLDACEFVWRVCTCVFVFISVCFEVPYIICCSIASFLLKIIFF